MSWVLRTSKATLGDRLVLLVLADHSSGDGTNSYPSVATIAAEALLSERQARYCLRRLEEAGSIVRSGKGPKGTTNYTIVMEGGQILPPYVKVQGAICDTRGGHSTAPEPSLNLNRAKALTNKPFCERCVGGLTLTSPRRLREHLFDVHGVES